MKNMPTFVVTVPADGLARLDASESAGAVMVKLWIPTWRVNVFRIELLWGKLEIDLPFLSFLYTEITQELENPQERRAVSPSLSTTRLLMSRCHALTHWGRVTHICVRKLTIIGSDNGLSPGRRQAIIWTNDRILLMRPLGTNFSEIFIRNSNIFIHENALENVVCQMASICLGVNVLNSQGISSHGTGVVLQQYSGFITRRVNMQSTARFARSDRLNWIMSDLRASSIPNNIYTPVPGVISPVENRLWSTRWDFWVPGSKIVSNSWNNFS